MRIEKKIALLNAMKDLIKKTPMNENPASVATNKATKFQEAEKVSKRKSLNRVYKYGKKCPRMDVK